MLNRSLRQYTPKPIKKTIKYGINYIQDSLDYLKGKSEELLPPRRINYEGNQGYKECGDRYLRYFVELAGLKSDHNVLEIGCGFGRIARPLVDYLSLKGSYSGVDIVPSGINWLTGAYARYPNFSFYLADIWNKSYNPQGKCNAVNYTFPFENEAFDFVILVSVFTHMFPKEMENYVRQILRILRKGGTCYITYFLLNKDSIAAIRKGATKLPFKHELTEYWTVNKSSPTDAIAFPEQWVRNLYDKERLCIMEPIYYGSWCHERLSPLDLQDIIIAKKE